MIKNRDIQSQDWGTLRTEIQNIIQGKKIPESDFKALGIHEDHKKIEERIYSEFCKLDNPTHRSISLWENFNLDTFSIKADKPHLILKLLLESTETVWLFLNDNKNKFWFYEAKLDAIITVIEESIQLDEIYIASKKYKWLICINHHDYLIATGEKCQIS